MCEPATLAITAAVVSAGSQVYSGLAANAQGKYEQQVAQQNAAQEGERIIDAKERGAIDRMRRYRQASLNIGRQRANASAMGLDANFGSVLDIQDETTRIADEDAYLISRNTTNEIEGYDINVANFRAQGQAARSRGRQALISSGINAAGSLLGGAQQYNRLKGRNR